MEEKTAEEQVLQTDEELQAQTDAQTAPAAESWAPEAAAVEGAQPLPAAENDGQNAASEEIGDQNPSETAQQMQTEMTMQVELLHTSEPVDEDRVEGNGMLVVIAGVALLAVIAAVAVAWLLLRRQNSVPTELSDAEAPDTRERDTAHKRKPRKLLPQTADEPEDLIVINGEKLDGEADEKTEDRSSEKKLKPEVETTVLIGSPAKHPRFVLGKKATVGGRKEQQDSFYYSNSTDTNILDQRGMLVAVADGIGGLEDGSLASEAAMQAIQSSFVQGVFNSKGSKKLLSLVAAAQRNVLNLNQSGHQCGCTLVTVLIENWDLYLASVGDSRIYLYRGGGLIVLNREHTLQRENDERMAVAREEVSPENLRRGKAITSYLGKVNLRLIDRTVYPLRLLPGDRIALMSDGIFGTLSDEEIAEALRKPPQEAADTMVASIDARNDPRQDNATVVVIAVE